MIFNPSSLSFWMLDLSSLKLTARPCKVMVGFNEFSFWGQKAHVQGQNVSFLECNRKSIGLYKPLRNYGLVSLFPMIWK